MTTASGNASDSAGDQIAVQLSVGEPVPASEISDAAVQGCESELSTTGSSVARSAAIRVTVTVTVVSSEAVTVELDMGDSADAADNNYGALLNIDQLYPYLFWATTYSDSGAVCTRSTDATGVSWGSVTWQNLAPNRPGTWTSYLVWPEAITPAAASLSDPQNPINAVIFDPSVTIADSPGEGLPLNSGQAGVVTCPGTLGQLFLADDLAGAEAQGCTTG
jgi:hypothetical protein